MVRSSQKAISIILCLIMVFAGSALCALGVAADTIDGLSNSLNFGIRGGSHSFTGQTLPVVSSNFQDSRQFHSYIYFSDSPFPAGYYRLYVVVTFTVGALRWDSSNPQVSVLSMNSYGWSNSSFSIPGTIDDISISTTHENNTFQIASLIEIHLTSSVKSLLFRYSGIDSNGGSVTYCSFDSFEGQYNSDEYPSVVSDPDPSTSYTPVETGVYFTNSKRSDLSVWNYNNTVSESLPLREYVNQSQPWDFYCGALITNWSDIFRSNTVLQGEVQIGAVDLTVLADVPDASFSQATCYFVSSTEPSSANFQYQAVPSTWESEIYSYRTTLNNYGYAYTISFYIVIPDTYLSDLNFTPVDLCFMFGNFHPASGGNYAAVFSKFDFNYYFFGSSPSAEAPSNPDNGIPDSAVEPTPITEVSEQTQWLTQQYYSDDDQYDDLISSLSESSSNVNFELYGRSLDRLSQMLTSTSMQFDFKLPSAYIPAISDKVPRIELWDNTKSIPFKTYIDQLPVQYKKIIGFIVLFSAASAIIGSYGLFFRRLLRKDVTT